MRRTILHRLSIALVFAVAACRGEGTGAGGTLVVGIPAEPEKILPPLYNETMARAISEVVYDKLADIGPELNTVGDVGYAPRLAQRWEWSRDSLQIVFHLDPRARWHDGVPVRAGDVRFAWQVTVDTAVASPKASTLGDELDSVTVRDSLTAVAWYKRRTAEQFHQVVNNLIPLPAHLLAQVPRDSLATSAAARALVGSGPFRVVKWATGQSVELAADTAHYRGRPKLDRVIFLIVGETSTLLAKFYGGELDVVDNFPAGDVPELRKHADLRLTTLGSFSYNYIVFNLFDGASDRPHPVFGDRGVRRALTMALDRDAMVRNVFGDVVATGIGPLTHAQWSYDPSLTPIPFDTAAARKTLDSLGWRAGADGVRAKNGHKLAFSMIVPASSKARLQLAPLIQAQWKQVGAQLDVVSQEPRAIGPLMSKHAFDAIFGGLTASPSPSGVHDAWAVAPAPGSAYNVGRYVNAAFAAQVDSGIGATTVPAAKTHFRDAMRLIIGDAPAVWMYEPPNLLATGTRVQTPPLRRDAWWANLEQWSFAPGATPARAPAAKAP